MESLPNRPPPARSLVEVVKQWVVWFGLVRLIVIVASIVGVGAGAYWLLRAPATPVENSLPFATTSSSTTTPALQGVDSGPPSSATSSATATHSLVVYVAGAVSTPGVYELAAAARVDDAVAAAGGLAPDADLEALNLAAFVSDGDRVFVPRVGQPVPPVVVPAGGTGRAGSDPTNEPGPVNINEATAEELNGLPGVGPSTAAAIVAHREEAGPYASVDDLLDVRGIGPAKLDAIRALVTV